MPVLNGATFLLIGCLVALSDLLTLHNPSNQRTAAKWTNGNQNEIAKRPAVLSRRSETGSCRTEQVEIDVSFTEIQDEDGRAFVMECRGKVTVSKCEGACLSSVTPSVTHYQGYNRECSCCKEGRLSAKTVTLTTCYDGPNRKYGRHITGSVDQPAECSCSQCRA